MRGLITLGAVCVTGLAVASIASAAPPVVASGLSPFTGCTADNPVAQQAFSTLYPNAEPEPRSDINPTNPLNIVGAYQAVSRAAGNPSDVYFATVP